MLLYPETVTTFGIWTSCQDICHNTKKKRKEINKKCILKLQTYISVRVQYLFSEIMYLIKKLKNKGKIVLGQSLEKFKDTKLYKTRVTCTDT